MTFPLIPIPLRISFTIASAYFLTDFSMTLACLDLDSTREGGSLPKIESTISPPLTERIDKRVSLSCTQISIYLEQDIRDGSLHHVCSHSIPEARYLRRLQQHPLKTQHDSPCQRCKCCSSLSTLLTSAMFRGHFGHNQSQR